MRRPVKIALEWAFFTGSVLFLIREILVCSTMWEVCLPWSNYWYLQWFF
jgi:hypothetical protein